MAQKRGETLTNGPAVEGLCHIAAFVVRLKGGKLAARGRGWLLPTSSCSPS